MSARAERQLRLLRLARDCWALGARARTLHHVTGLSPSELQRLFFAEPASGPRGRAPDSPEWYHGANLLYRAEASIIASVYRRLRVGGFAAGEALVGAYQQYQSVCQCPYRISFDRAFDLIAHTDGIWVSSAIAFAVVHCPICDSAFLAAAGADTSTREDCPFCRLVQRYPHDHRVQSSFPMQPVSDALAPRLRVMALAGLAEADRRADGERTPQ